MSPRPRAKVRGAKRLRKLHLAGQPPTLALPQGAGRAPPGARSGAGAFLASYQSSGRWAACFLGTFFYLFWLCETALHSHFILGETKAQRGERT